MTKVSNEEQSNNDNVLLADSLPLSELKDLLCEVSQLIAGWNATEAQWSKWDEEVKQKVYELQVKIDGIIQKFIKTYIPEEKVITLTGTVEERLDQITKLQYQKALVVRYSTLPLVY